MTAYFLLLYAGVELIQEKKFFSSAPHEVFAAVPDKKRTLCIFFFTSPYPPPSHGCVRFSEAHSA